jgi:mycofactocin system glycosyltransferase
VGSIAELPVPVGFRLVADPSTVEEAPGLWSGGRPRRVLRLSAAGQRAWAGLRVHGVSDAVEGRVARRLLDAGLAHPIPPVVQQPDVTVVVPVRDRAAALDRCLGALPAGYPVIVVDDASVEPAPVRAVAERHGARLVRLEVNGGPGVARNAGLAEVATELVAFVDSDIEGGGRLDWIAALAGHLLDPAVAAVAPRVTPASGPGWTGRYAHARSPLDLGVASASVRPNSAVSYVPTAAVLARRGALHSVARDAAVFDPALRVGEDVDLIWRLVDAGWRVRYDPAVEVAHREPSDWRGLFARRFRYGRSSADLALRHPGHLVHVVVHAWFAAPALALIAGRPRLAGLALAAATARSGRQTHQAGLPLRGTLRRSVAAVAQSWVGFGRYALQFGFPAVALLGIRRGWRGRGITAALLATPALTTWCSTERHLDPVRFTAAAVADDLTYGAGVFAGCLSRRTVRPLLPRLTGWRATS